MPISVLVWVRSFIEPDVLKTLYRFYCAGLAMGILSVRLFVRLSVTRVYCDKTVVRSVQIYTHTKEHLS